MRVLFVVSIPFVVILAFAFARFLYDQWEFISGVFRAGVVVGSAFLVIGAVVAIVLYIINWSDQRKATQAQLKRDNVEVVVAKPGDQVYEVEYDTDVSTNTRIRPAHLAPVGLNGSPMAVTDVALDLWRQDKMLSAVSNRVRESIQKTIETADSDSRQIDLRPPPFSLLDRLPNNRGDINHLLIADRVNPETGAVESIYAHIEDIVHPMYSGETNTGKSTAARGFAYQFITAPNTHHWWADRKNATWKVFDGANGQQGPIVTNDEDMITVLGALATEAQRRIELFEPFPLVEKLSEYNRQAQDDLPYIMLFADEFPGFMANKKINKLICDNLFLWRSVGIYVCGIGTYWNADTIPTKSRSCFLTRVALPSSRQASQVVLDSPDASDLDGKDRGLGYGKLLFGDHGSKHFLLRVPYLDKRDAYALVPRLDSVPALPMVDTPDETEADILATYDEDESQSASAIAEATIGKGGSQLKKIRSVILKYRGVSI